MKKIFTLLTVIVLSITILNAQEAPPQAFSFKAIIKIGNKLIVNQNISLQISILKNSVDLEAVYTETFYTKTNASGQIDIEIGHGNAPSSVFSEIKWWSDEYFLKIEVDVKGGENYELLSVTQLFSVPYALYSDKAGSALSVDYNHLTNRPVGTNVGDMQYWDGEDWVMVPAGLNGQVLTLYEGVPKWGGSGEVPNQSPILYTNGISDPTPTSFITGGYILSDGGTPVTQRGVCWNTTGTPTIDDPKTEDGGGSGGFTSNVTGLTVGITYYVRAYATNNVGTGYGDPISFTTSQIRVTGITLNTSSLTLLPPETSSLTATVMPEDAYNKTVSWTSSNIAVATVTETGLVTAVANGITTITATTNDGGLTAACEVRVAQYNLHGIITSNLDLGENNIVSVSGTVQISEGITLSVGQGTVVYGNGNEIQSWGNFVATGNASNKIILDNLNLTAKTGGFCDLLYCVYNSGTIFGNWGSYNGHISLKYSEINDLTSQIIIYWPNADCLIEGNIFKNCYGLSIYCDSKAITINNNTFEQMKSCPIEIGYVAWADIDIHGNRFMDTGEVQIKVATGSNVVIETVLDAISNWWNTTDENVINSMIFDKKDDLNSPAYILYDPILLTDPGLPDD